MPHQPPPLSDHLTNSVYTVVPLDKIAPTMVESSMEEMSCLSAPSSEVSTILSPPTMPTYDNPGSRGVTTVGVDPGYLARVENQVEDQALFVKAVLV
jgi:hypothetical protein